VTAPLPLRTDPPCLHPQRLESISLCWDEPFGKILCPNRRRYLPRTWPGFLVQVVTESLLFWFEITKVQCSSLP